MRVGSLFSGIGGLDLGLERAGMEIVWQVEVDDWCRRVLARHFPNAVRYGDVRKCRGEHAAELADAERAGAERSSPPGELGDRRPLGSSQLAPVDLICGGFPCQPVSHAGQRKGADDERWLWPEFRRIIREVRPRWVLVENVPGLLSIDSGRLFGGILADLAALGYDAEWDCIGAADLGAPHLRKRVFIVAHAISVPGQKRGDVGPDAGAGRQGRDHPGSSRGDGSRVTDACAHEVLADTGQQLRDGRLRWASWWSREPAEALSDARRDGRQANGEPIPESLLGRVAHGVPSRVDRLRGLGNAVVPQVAEYIGRLIMEWER